MIEIKQLQLLGKMKNLLLAAISQAKHFIECIDRSLHPLGTKKRPFYSYAILRWLGR